MLNDPELYVATAIGFRGVRNLIDDAYLDAQVRGPVADLMYVNIMKHHGCQQGMETYIENYVGRDTFDVRKTVLIDFPDSDVYSPEERLAIKFSKAVLENTMMSWRYCVGTLVNMSSKSCSWRSFLSRAARLVMCPS